MYLEIDIHKRYAQMAVVDEAENIAEEIRVENVNIDDVVDSPTTRPCRRRSPVASRLICGVY